MFFFFKIMPLGPKVGHMFCIYLYRENMKISSCLKPQGGHMFCIDLYRLRLKMGPPQGSHILHRLT